ncbi:hypothetical protein HYW40_00640 [Candidatus Curtissbacteria bacterium]|nr:hypothetical protein [Candidatus Curtissbacteria bacterium]
MKKLIVNFQLLVIFLISLSTIYYLLFPSPSLAVELDTDIPGSTSGPSKDSGLGKITPPEGLVKDVGADPSAFVAGLVRNGISLLLIVSFVIALIWTIINGLRFILANGDEKTIASAWSQIYWTLIGMTVVLGAFAIIKLVETFFDVRVLSIPFQLPTPK